jgi:hypothetical protein
MPLGAMAAAERFAGWEPNPCEPQLQLRYLRTNGS